MNDPFFDIDVDSNHFSHYFRDTNNQYYTSDRFNDSFNSDCSRDLSIFHLNIRSIYRNGNDLIAYLSLLNRKFDVICLCETFVNNLLLVSNFFDDYSSFHSIRGANERGGGVAIYVRKELCSHVLSSLTVNHDYIESVFVRITHQNKSTIVGCCYRPPASSRELFLQFCDENFSHLNTNVNDVIIAGDFNLCMLRASDSNQLASFYDTMHSCFLTPTILNPSRFSNDSCSLIDNIFVSNCNHFTSGLLRVDISDHLPIFLIKHNYFDLESSSRTETVTYRLINDDTLSRLYHAMLGANLLGCDLETLHFTLQENFCRCCPLKSKSISPKDRLKPWIGNDLKIYIKLRESYFCLFKRNLVSEQFYKSYRNFVTKKIRLAKKRYFEDLFSRIRNNARKTWSVIRSIISQKSESGRVDIQSLVVDGVTLTDGRDIAEAFNVHFSSVGKKIDQSLPLPLNRNCFMNYVSSSPINSFFFVPIHPSELSHIIHKMKNKSSHIGTYSVRIVKYLSDILSPILCQIFNNSFETGHFPNFCKVARVIPLFKSGDCSSLNNFRPISILPIFSKIFEKLVYQQLYGFLMKNNFFTQEQYGFRRNFSTSDAIIDMTQFVYDSLDLGKTVVSFFLDFSKAFDCVNHVVLLRKLEACGVRGLANNWFCSYLNNRSQYVEIKNEVSSSKLIEYGVPQGSTLGPLLFLIFINDFPSCSNFFKFTLFADDSTLSCSFDHSNTSLMKIELERQLLPVLQWLSHNRIKLNSDKSNYIIFSYRKNIVIDSVQFGDSLLRQVHSTKFLGLHIDEHLTFRCHVDHVVKKISKSVGLLFKLNYYLPQHILVTLYNTLILPYLNYGVVIWHNACTTVLNRVVVSQKRAIRAICQLEFNAHTNDYFKNLNILKFSDLFKINLCTSRFKQIKNPRSYAISTRFVRNDDFHSYLTRNRSNFATPLYFRSSSQSCYLYQASVEFNNLPSSLRECSSLSSFRKNMKKFLIDLY